MTGQQDRAPLPTRPVKVAIVTVSDEVADGSDTDRGGDVALQLLTEAGHDVSKTVVGDDDAAIESAIKDAVDAGNRVVMTCGGTGIGPSDRTCAVVGDLLSFEMPGIAEEIRRKGAAHAPQALVSRELAGAIVHKDGRPPVFILAAPGSRGGVRDAISVVGPLLGYIVEQLDGAGHQ